MIDILGVSHKYGSWGPAIKSHIRFGNKILHREMSCQTRLILAAQFKNAYEYLKLTASFVLVFLFFTAKPNETNNPPTWPVNPLKQLSNATAGFMSLILETG